MGETPKNNDLEKIEKKLNLILKKLNTQKKEQIKEKVREKDFQFLSKLEIVNFGILFTFLNVSVSSLLSNIPFFLKLHLFLQSAIIIFIFYNIYLILSEIKIIYDENNLVERFRFFNKMFAIFIVVIGLSIVIYTGSYYLDPVMEGIYGMVQTIIFGTFLFVLAFSGYLLDYYFQKWFNKNVGEKFNIIFEEYLKKYNEELKKAEEEKETENEKSKEKMKKLGRKLKLLFKNRKQLKHNQ